MLKSMVLALALCLPIAGAARADEPWVLNQPAYRQGIACLTVEDTEKMVAIVVDVANHGGSMQEVLMRSMGDKVQCIPAQGIAVYRGVAKEGVVIGGNTFNIIKLNDPGSPPDKVLYSWIRTVINPSNCDDCI